MNTRRRSLTGGVGFPYGATSSWRVLVDGVERGVVEAVSSEDARQRAIYLMPQQAPEGAVLAVVRARAPELPPPPGRDTWTA